MKKYIVQISDAAYKDIENVISYLRNDLLEDIVADKKVRGNSRKYANIGWKINWL